MAHTDRHYDDPDPQVNKTKALADIEQWLGKKKFKSFAADIKLHQQSRIVSRGEFRFALMIGGIEGYPVEVWADELGIPPAESKDEVEVVESSQVAS